MAFGLSRPVLLAAVFAATAAAAIAGAAVRGESRDNPREVACAAAEWPMIPAECLEGGDGDVRVIDGDLRAAEAEYDAEEDELRFRFEAAFSG
jgi:hypothetical protein